MSRYNRKDRFFQQAKREQFAARSVYKLEELDRRFHLLKKGSRIVDLGCAPGSWLQYIAEAVAPKGVVVGYDLAQAQVSAGPNARYIVADVHDLTPARIQRDVAAALSALRFDGDAGAAPAETETETETETDAVTETDAEEVRASEAPPPEAREGLAPRIDGLVSDMAPKLTGVRDADQVRAVELARRALELAEGLVRPGGFFVAKLFQGRETDQLLNDVKRAYREVKLLKPEATREGSREVFVVAKQRKGS